MVYLFFGSELIDSVFRHFRKDALNLTKRFNKVCIDLVNFLIGCKILYGNITRHTEPLTMHWRKNFLDQFHMKHDFSTATNTA